MGNFFTKHLGKISLFFGLIGAILLIINIAGLFIPLRNPEIYSEEKVGFENDITLTNDEAIKLLAEDLPRKEYIIQANEVVNQSIAHYWDDEGIDKYNLRIPFYKNYILYGMSFVVPSIYQKYEFCNYEKAIERGAGICSQHAIALTNILNRHGIESKIIGLDGHVVSTALVDETNNEWWVLDPDYGIIISEDIETIERNPKIIESYYLKKYPMETVQLLESLYEEDGNIVYPTGVKNYVDCNWKKISFRKISYIMKWIIPTSLIAFYLLSISQKRLTNLIKKNND